MSRKIIGATVGTTLPKPNLAQTDPKMGDYVKGREAVIKRIEDLEGQLEEILADMNYQDIAITEFKCPGAGTYEIGTSVAAPKIEWSLNKDPASQNINGEALDVTDRSKPYSGIITSTKSYKLTVTGQKGEKDDRTGTFTFLNGVYYGVCDENDRGADAIDGMTEKRLQSGRALTFTANAGARERIVYAIPSRYGKPTFTDAETKLSAGMYLADEDFDFTNSSGYTEKYNLWLSEQPGLGELTIVVS